LSQPAEEEIERKIAAGWRQEAISSKQSAISLMSSIKRKKKQEVAGH